MSRFITLMVAVFIATTAHAATTTINVAGDPLLKVVTDLPQNNQLVVQVLAGVKAARDYLGKDSPQEVYIYQDRATLLTVSKMPEQQWGSKWAVTGGNISYYYAPVMTVALALRVGARETAIGYFNGLLGRRFSGRETEVPFDGPYWLMEGGADVVTRVAAGIQKPLSPAVYLSQLDSWQHFSAVQASKTDAYAASQEAVDFLTQLTGVKIAEYWKARGKVPVYAWTTWEETFEQAYHISADEFSTKWAAHVGLSLPRTVTIGKAR